MSFVGGGGVSKLSGITIDVDKDWAGFGISNIKQLALGMIQGDILVHDGTRIIRLAAGIANQVLTSGGPGVVPSWAPGGTHTNRYVPATLSGPMVAAIVAAARTFTKNAPLTSPYVDATGDLPASHLKMVSPAVSLSGTRTVIAAPDQTYTKAAAIGTTYTTAVA